MTREEIAEVLADESLPNAPEAIEGINGSVRVHVDPVQARERRTAMSAAIMQGASRDTIMQLFTAKFGMSEQAIAHLMAEVRDVWAEEDADAVRSARGAARRRLLGHIREASKDRKWNAVGNLEKVLTEIEGTLAPEVNPSHTDDNARMMEAVMSMIGQTDVAQIRILIEKERTMIEMGPAADKLAHLPKSIMSGTGG